MKNLPNILSISRIIVSCLLFFIGGYPILFSILYLYCGISDVADGYIARRWKVESAIGAKLDSFGDLIFYVLITVTFVIHTELTKETWILWLIVFIFIFKILSIIVIKVRFHQWGMMHTIANKTAGLCVYFLLPAYILIPSLPIVIGALVVTIALLASFEEMLIALTVKQFDPNRKSFFCKDE